MSGVNFDQSADDQLCVLLEPVKTIRNEATAAAEVAPPDRLERLYSIKVAAELLGIKYWLLLHAVNQGSIPSYRIGNTRRRVRLSDIEAVLQASRG
jgi:excisionase family DNA binding protein